MKLYLSFFLVAACLLQAGLQQATAQGTLVPHKKNCYDEYHQTFIARGADPVPDGEQNVVFSVRDGKVCACGEGKVTVKDGKILPSLLVKKVDGTYEPSKKLLHSHTWKEESFDVQRFDIVNGMSASFRTEDDMVGNLFFIDYLKRKVVANAPAPSPNDIEGRQPVTLNEKEKEILKQAYEGLQFETGKAVIMKTSFAHLNLLATMLKEKPDYLLNINGYTDNVGNAASNLILSQDRAENVKAYLIKQGVEESRITSEGYGLEDPIADNNTAEGRAKNRRVEFIVFN
jgi:outer membrane protein OmpA-like peptidoglycan-associated protein